MRKVLALVFSFALLVSFVSLGDSARACLPDDPGYGLC